MKKLLIILSLALAGCIDNNPLAEKAYQAGYEMGKTTVLKQWVKSQGTSFNLSQFHKDYIIDSLKVHAMLISHDAL